MKSRLSRSYYLVDQFLSSAIAFSLTLSITTIRSDATVARLAVIFSIVSATIGWVRVTISESLIAGIHSEIGIQTYAYIAYIHFLLLVIFGIAFHEPLIALIFGLYGSSSVLNEFIRTLAIRERRFSYLLSPLLVLAIIATLLFLKIKAQTIFLTVAMLQIILLHIFKSSFKSSWSKKFKYNTVLFHRTLDFTISALPNFMIPVFLFIFLNANSVANYRAMLTITSPVGWLVASFNTVILASRIRTTSRFALGIGITCTGLSVVLVARFFLTNIGEYITGGRLNLIFTGSMILACQIGISFFLQSCLVDLYKTTNSRDVIKLRIIYALPTVLLPIILGRAFGSAGVSTGILITTVSSTMTALVYLHRHGILKGLQQ